MCVEIREFIYNNVTKLFDPLFDWLVLLKSIWNIEKKDRIDGTDNENEMYEQSREAWAKIEY